MRDHIVVKSFLFVLLLGACGLIQKKPETFGLDKITFVDYIQSMIVKREEAAISSLPAGVSGIGPFVLLSSEPVADREQNQKGAGFTRVYQYEDALATVFLYNNQDFGVANEITPETEALMDKHLSEMQAMQDSGLYTQVKIGEKKIRKFRFSGVDYQVVEAEVEFIQKGEQKISFFVLGANKELMSFIRIRLTYPRSMRAAVNKNRNIFTREIFAELNSFATNNKMMQ